MVTQVLNIPIDAIEPDPEQPRKKFSREALETLALSLKKEGMLQPITVRQAGNGRYIIIAGERRWRAAKMLGWKEVPAIIRDIEDEAQLRRLQLLENIVRADLNPLEEAQAYAELLDKGETVESLSRAVGKTPQQIQYLLQILNLIPTARHYIAIGKIPISSIGHLARLSENGQKKALLLILNKDLSPVAQWELCSQIYAEECQMSFGWELEKTKRQGKTLAKAMARLTQRITFLTERGKRNPTVVQDILPQAKALRQALDGLLALEGRQGNEV